MKIGDLSQAHAPADPLGGPAVRALFLVFVASLVIALIQTLSSLHAERTYAQKKAAAEGHQAEASEPHLAPLPRQSSPLQVADADPNVSYTGSVLSGSPTNPYLDTMLLSDPVQKDNSSVPPAAPSDEKSFAVQDDTNRRPSAFPIAVNWPGTGNADAENPNASADVAPAASAAVPPSPPAPPLPPASPPRVATAEPPAATTASAEPAARRGRSSGLVDLNTASVKQLNSLRGRRLLGRAIVRGRPYASTEDLVTKRVVNRSTYERIKDQIAVR